MFSGSPNVYLSGLHYKHKYNNVIYKQFMSPTTLGAVKKSIPWKHMMDKEGNNLPTMFNFSTIDIATNHFSNRNKLGEGGFGTVHKVGGQICSWLPSYSY